MTVIRSSNTPARKGIKPSPTSSVEAVWLTKPRRLEQNSYLMKFRQIVAALALTALALPAASVNPATKPQVAPMTAQEKKNLDFVLRWYREVIYAGHVELAPKYQAENYIQHNPNLNTGRA